MGNVAKCNHALLLIFVWGELCSALTLQGNSGERKNDPWRNWCKSANSAACDKESQTRKETWNKAMETRIKECKESGKACDFGNMQPSGPGSSLQATEGLRPWLRQVFDITGARSVLDVPCGDLTWMPHVNLSGIEYVGGDISAEIVEYNNRQLVDDNRFSGRICMFDIICEVAPKRLVDLIISRDVLFHLPTKDSIKALRNFEASGAKFLVSTTFRHNRGEVQDYDPEQNEHAYTDTAYGQSDAVIGYYEIDLFAPPFCLPDPPLAVLEEGHGRIVGLWQLPALNTSTSKACKEFRASGSRMKGSDLARTSLEEKYGVNFVLYHVQLEQSNKHSPDYYLQSLGSECRSLAEEHKRFTTLGDISFFRSVPECAPAATSSVWQRSFGRLPYGGDVSMQMDTDCGTKFGAELPAGQFRNMSRIWLSKLPLLCEVAEKEPDQVTVLLDSGMLGHKEQRAMRKRRWKFALGALSEQDFEAEAVHMPHYSNYQLQGKLKWFRSDLCSESPRVNAMFMAVRGRHCPKLMRAYSDALLRVRAKACRCFDEEIVISDMLIQTGLVRALPL